MSEFTPGPWKSGRPDMATIVDGYDSKWIYADKRYVAVASGMHIKDWEEVMANAHLIAAAPELYETLKLFVNIIEDHGTSDPDYVTSGWLAYVEEELDKAVKKANKALAKAAGGE